MGEFQEAESENKTFRGGNLSTYPVIDELKPDLLEFRSNVLIHLGLVGCDKLLDKDFPEKYVKINEEDYNNDVELWTLVQGINIQRRLLFSKKERHVFGVLKQACMNNSVFKLRVQNINQSDSANIEIWRIINEYLEKDATRHLEDISNKWQDLFMLPDEPYRNYFSRIDAVISEFKSKCDMVISDPQIFSLIHTRVHPDIADRITLFKQLSVGAPSWDSIKVLIVDYSESFTNRGRTSNMDYKYENSEKRREDAYIAQVETRNCFYCLEAGHVSRDCPLRALHYKTKGSDFVDQHRLNQKNKSVERKSWSQDNSKENRTHYEPKKTTERIYGAVKCTRCLVYGHLATSCPRLGQKL